MELTISAGDGEALEQFYRWLREDVDVMRVARVGMTAAPGSGHMGAFEIISMTLSNTTALTSLAIAYANWRKARKDPPALKFSVEGELPEELVELIRKLNKGDD